MNCLSKSVNVVNGLFAPIDSGKEQKREHMQMVNINQVDSDVRERPPLITR